MNKDFVLYPQAVALRDLGFNEPCLGFYDGKGDTTLYFNNLRDASGDFELFSNNKRLTWFGAPTYSQAFRFFREKHSLRSFVDTRVYSVDTPNQWVYDFQVKMGNGIDTQPFYSGDFDTYEEAESACLDKLIEIINDKQNHK